MCAGIAIVGIVPDIGPIQFFGKNGNSSHDTVLSECVPVEMHNKSFKIEYIFPNQIRLDAPDEECRKQVVELGVAEIRFGTAIFRLDVLSQVAEWLQKNSPLHDKTTLQQANLSRADLSGADLSWADLSGADLSRADLSGANLSRADLSEADLSGADLSGANLSWANLSRANLSEADLSRADLSGANLSRANLSEADLSWADLSGANLSRANLSRANLSDEQKMIAKNKGAVGVD